MIISFRVRPILFGTPLGRPFPAFGGRVGAGIRNVPHSVNITNLVAAVLRAIAVELRSPVVSWLHWPFRRRFSGAASRSEAGQRHSPEKSSSSLDCRPQETRLGPPFDDCLRSLASRRCGSLSHSPACSNCLRIATLGWDRLLAFAIERSDRARLPLNSASTASSRA